MRTFMSAGLAWLVLSHGVLAMDDEIKGSILQIDLKAKTLVVQTAKGKRTLALVGPTRVFAGNGAESKDGLKDKRLVPGVEVRVVPTITGKTAREIHLPAGHDEKKPPAKADAARGDANSLVGKLLKVDAENRTARIQLNDGAKLDIKIDAEVKFIGPKGGVSAKGIKDDRFKEGAQVRIVMEGKSVKEIHLPLRGK